jgi:hypothetical protein
MIPRRRNSVPTAGEVRVARSRADVVARPVLRRLRHGLLFGLGVADVVLSASTAGIHRAPLDPDEAGSHRDRPTGVTRAAVTLTRRGARRYARVRSVPAVQRVVADLARARRNAASETGQVLDAAHDSVEENLARVEIGTGWLVALVTARGRDAIRALRALWAWATGR